MKIDFYVIDDRMIFDGKLGWVLEAADYKRNWMERTPHRYAYRCLPLTIANQLGWWLKNPVKFWANWNGKPEPDDVSKNIQFTFDRQLSKEQVDYWSSHINCQFGAGIITWNTPYLIVTDIDTQVIVSGINNNWILGAYPLTGVIETNWMVSSFTMNYKILEPNKLICFDLLIPLIQIIPAHNIISNYENAECAIHNIKDNIQIHQEYSDWDNKRKQFHKDKHNGLVVGNSWQKDYFLGKKSNVKHYTKIEPPTLK